MEVVKLWPWDDAPEGYKLLSSFGGDEDWVIEVPRKYQYDVGVVIVNAVKVYKAEEHDLGNVLVYITTHA